MAASEDSEPYSIKLLNWVETVRSENANTKKHEVLATTIYKTWIAAGEVEKKFEIRVLDSPDKVLS